MPYNPFISLYPAKQGTACFFKKGQVTKVTKSKGLSQSKLFISGIINRNINKLWKTPNYHFRITG